MKYPKAPIVETVIDFRVTFKTPPSTGALRKFASQFRDRFSDVKDTMQGKVTVPFGKTKEGPTLEKEHTGVRLESTDPPRVLQVRVDGFSYSHLAPYTEWETFSREAAGYWQSYVSSLRPLTVRRYAVRSINKFVIPSTEFDVAAYFNIQLALPDELAPTINSFFLQAQLPQPMVGADTIALIHFASAEAESFETSAIVLDIDIFSPAKLPADSKELWDRLESLRVRKNELFEACITDQARGLIS